MLIADMVAEAALSGRVTKADPTGTPTPAEDIRADLSPAARQAAGTLASSLIGPVAQRAETVFLGIEDYETVEYHFSELMADLMLESLARFAGERAGEIVLSAILNDQGEVLTATRQVVTVGGRTRQFIRYGYIFIYFPDERVVVSAENDCGYPGHRVLLRVRSNRDSAAFLANWIDYARSHNYLRGAAFYADGEIIEKDPERTWDTIYLPERTKAAVRTHVEGFLKSLGRLKDLGLKTRRGIILSGPPGTGKTLLGKVLANTVEASFLWVSPRHVEQAWGFKDIMELARFVAPTVVFLEDLDLFAEDREFIGGNRLGELMNQLDGAVENTNIVTIATTNHLEAIEKALRNRPGRFDRVIEFGEMEDGCRQQMLDRMLRKMDIVPQDLDYLVRATKGYTGAQVEEVVNTMCLLAAEQFAGPTAPAGSACPKIKVDRSLISRAMDECRVESKARVGFYAV